MTTIMGDVGLLEFYQVWQKQFQRDDLISCDGLRLTCRESTLQKFQLLENCPYPKKRESTLSTANAESDSNSTERRYITMTRVSSGTVCLAYLINQ